MSHVKCEMRTGIHFKRGILDMAHSNHVSPVMTAQQNRCATAHAVHRCRADSQAAGAFGESASIWITRLIVRGRAHAIRYVDEHCVLDRDTSARP